MTQWPELRIADSRDTYTTLQLYVQTVGKIRLALTPKMNEWCNVTFYVTPRGLTTSTMPYGDRTLSIDFDFIDHASCATTSKRPASEARSRARASAASTAICCMASRASSLARTPFDALLCSQFAASREGGFCISPNSCFI
jgi:hypothetical protein